jgi:hypothetical protein
MQRYQGYQEAGTGTSGREGGPAARCARGEHCGSMIRNDDETTEPGWADPPLPFCRRDAGAVSRALAAMPERYVSLHMILGQKTRIPDDRVSGSRTAPVPLRLDVDELIRDMVMILCSWEERAADAGRLTRPATWMSRYRRDQVSIPAAVAVLEPRLEEVLLFRSQPMIRVIPIGTRKSDAAAAASMEARKMTGWAHRSAGYAEIFEFLDGAAAGLEFLQLDYRARRTLGQTQPPPEMLDGIPCRECDALALEAAPEPEYKACCQVCGWLPSEEEYLAHVRRYGYWVRRQVAAGEVEPANMAEYAKLAA